MSGLAAILAGLCFISRAALAAETPLDRSLKPTDQEQEEVSNVFRDMGVVQRRAMPKGNRFLFSTFGTFDFTDGPYTRYALNLNPGYALSDFFEIYLNYVPTFFVSQRSIVQEVEKLTPSSGERFTISAATPQTQIGGEILWAPAYGKDSFGIRNVIRSDTFLKLSVGQIKYDAGTGMRFVGGLGKTYFLGRSAGMRICVDFGQIEDFIQNAKVTRSMVLLEAGLMLYL